MQTLRLVNGVIAVLFAVCYAYQLLYIPVPWIARKKEQHRRTPVHRFAVLICARNEAEVIADLLESIRGQTYPADRISVFVMADNCSDDTAAIAAAHGAHVYERHDTVRVGKGYALEALLASIRHDRPEGFDGYFIFDADNLLKYDYIEQMDRTFSEGNDIVTGYRNSKNYGDNWISAGYALWFLRESRYLNQPRSILGSSCAVSGTGFLFSNQIADAIGGWPFHMLTEDIEFSADRITKGERIAFCRDAELYDEQPVDFSQSWRQRMRWSRGYLQVFRRYGKELVKGAVHGHFSCFDMAMTIMPAFILSIASIVCNLFLGIHGALAGDNVMIAVRSAAVLFGNMYLFLFVLGGITTVTEWRHIHTPAQRKILYAFTFPLFMFTYIPISAAALFCNTGWKPIRHTRKASMLNAGIPVPSGRGK